METTIEDYKGNIIATEDAILINGKYYPLVECVIVRGHFIHKEDKRLTTDIFTGKLDLKSNLLPIIKSVEEYHSKTPSYTSSSLNSIEVILNESTTILIVNESIARDLGFIEGFKSGKFFAPDKIDLDKEVPFRTFDATKRSKNFSTKIEKTVFGVDTLSNNLLEGKHYSFGVEMETSAGYIPPYLDSRLNLKCVRDGSISGGEYVTGVLKGDSGLIHLQKICTELSKRCKVDARCGVHVHVGDVKFTKETVVYLLNLCSLVEKDIYSILPPSRRTNTYCKPIKGYAKDVWLRKTSSPLEYQIMIDEAYSSIFSFVSTQNSKPGKNINKLLQHPRGPRSGYVHDSPRYHWINLLPALFNTRENESYTVEFRCHSATTNFIKVKNWIKICMALVHYSENYKQQILEASIGKIKLTLEDIIAASYPRTSSLLTQYINERREKFNSTRSIEAEESEYIKERHDRVKSLTVKELIQECV